MGRRNSDPDEVPVHRVCLDTYWLDRTEVTVAAYSKCVNAGVCPKPKSYSVDEEWRKQCTWAADGKSQHPVNCLSWSQARTFCGWAGKRLPTEAEWEYAARGTADRMYPWGADEPTCQRVVMGNSAAKGCGKNGTWPVGSKANGATPEGLLDMAGNVWEWTEDCWYLNSYKKCVNGCRNPANRCQDSKRKRVIRGASFQYGPAKAKSFRTSLRGYYKPKAVGQGVGFRCAISGSKVATASPSSSSTSVTWTTIPGGNFRMGSAGGDADERPMHAVQVKSFQLTKTEVTVAQYRRCVTAGKCTPPTTGRYCNWNSQGLDSHPVNCVDWHQATAFASWIGGRLPSEAEWEYAARSGGLNQRYPWGNERPSCRLAVHDDKVTVSAGGSATDACGKDHTWPICSRSAGNSKQGVCDLAGSVWEWVADTYSNSYIGAPRDGSPWLLSSTGQRVFRGGGWGTLGKNLRATNRYKKQPSYTRYDLGFRVARSAP